MPQPARILGLDVARALAIIGMVAVDFEGVLSNQTGSIWFERFLQLPAGRASALFVVLAGIGTTFLAGRGLGESPWVLVRRALVLFALGYSFLALAWEEDILHFYGYYFLLAIPCLYLADRWLLVLAGLCLIPTVAFLQSGWDFQEGWVLDYLEYTDLWTQAGHLRHLFFNGFFPLTPWMAFVLWGMWLGRRLQADSGHVRDLAGKALALAVAIEVLSYVLVRSLGGVEDATAQLFDTAPKPPVPLFVLSAAAWATALIGYSCKVAERRPASLAVRVLVHTGQLALTIYLVHVVVGIGPFDVWYQLGCLTRSQVFAWWAGFSYLCLWGAHRWRRRFSQGPFEVILRKIGGRAA